MSKTSSHTRYLDSRGNIVPSVTTIIGNQLAWNKGALIGWTRKLALAGQDPEEVKDKSAEIGTLAHYLVECELKKISPDVSGYSEADLDIALTAFDAFKKWRAGTSLEMVASELPVVSEKYKYGGTIDLLVFDTDSDAICLIDLKTSNSLHLSHVVQVAAYKHAYEEVHGKISDVMILKLNKDSVDFHEYWVSNKQLDIGFRVFKHCLQLEKLQMQLEM